MSDYESQPQKIIAMETEERRAEILAMYRTGMTQTGIAEELGLSLSTVNKHIAKQREIWRNSSLVDFNEAQGRALELIDKIEAEAWEAWERSKKPLVMQMRYRNREGDMVDSLRQNNRDGDPRFLERMEWCVEQRCKILGLITTKHEVTHNQGQKIEVVEVVRGSAKPVEEHGQETLHD